MKIILIALSLICVSGTKAFTQIKKISVYFPFAKEAAEFNENIRILYFLADSIPDKTAFNIEIKGYCDNVDDDTVNNILSQKRANYIKTVLLNNGIPEQQIKLCKGYGEKVALNKNASEEERKVNRRTDIFFIPKMMSEKDIEQYEKLKSGTLKVLKDSIVSSDLVEGETLILDNLNFQPGRHILLPKSVPTLKQLLKAMQENTKLEIEIVGHICCEPNTSKDGFDMDTKKEELSLNRAKAVMNYLLKNGIDANRMSIAGKGAQEKLIEPEKTEQDMETNRRVEIFVKKS